MTAQSIRMRAELTFKGNLGRGRHGWLRLTPAYSVELVEQLSHPDGHGPMLDPFAGTGTTVIVAAERGAPAYGVDINPFLVWLGETKARRYTRDEVEGARCRARLDGDRLALPEPPEPKWVPALANIEKWWTADALCRLANLHNDLHLAEDIESGPQRLLAVVFCNVMMASANVSFGHQSMSFKQPQGVLFDSAQWLGQLFEVTLEEVLREAEAWEPRAARSFVLGDARHLDRFLPHGHFGQVVTSPPYPNRMSYVRELRPYMYWLGYLRSPRDAGELDWRAIGGTWGCATSNVATWEPEDWSVVDRVLDRRTFEAIDERSPVLARYVLKYFCDVEQHINALKSVLAPGAQVHYIVGNSKYYSTLVQTHDLYARLFAESGFTEVSSSVLRKRTSKKELYEYRVSAVAP